MSWCQIMHMIHAVSVHGPSILQAGISEEHQQCVTFKDQDVWQCVNHAPYANGSAKTMHRRAGPAALSYAPAEGPRK